MNEQELIHAIALTKLNTLSPNIMRTLLDTAGSATEIFAHSKDIRSIMPSASDKLAQIFSNASDAQRQAEQEMQFIRKNNIHPLMISDSDYPQRLLQCPDAPIVLYGCGSTNLNRPHVINIIGTRKCTESGRENCQRLVEELKQLVPDTLIVSGLAYGVDINAHRTSLVHGLDTVGILAHGLDRIYPYAHRQTASDIVHRGGALLTEYTSNTQPEKQNFVRRNRIVAGISDACVVIESSAKGGSLITARLAFGYSRQVFAFPGRTCDDSYSGCNNLIKTHIASLITSAEDLATAMQWCEPNPRKRKVPKQQQELFPTLTSDEQAIIATLANVDDKHINQISIETHLPFSTCISLLFNLETNGIVKALGGSRYHLIRK